MDTREEANLAVEALNDWIYEKGIEDMSPFSLTTTGWQNTVVRFMGEIIWTEEDDPRKGIDENEDLHQFLWKKAKEILNKVSGAMDSEKVASDYLIRMLEAIPEYIDVKYEIDDYGVHFVEVSDEDYVFGIIVDVFEERFPDQELLILTKESLNRVTKPIWENNEKSR